MLFKLFDPIKFEKFGPIETGLPISFLELIFALDEMFHCLVELNIDIFYFTFDLSWSEWGILLHGGILLFILRSVEFKGWSKRLRHLSSKHC